MSLDRRDFLKLGTSAALAGGALDGGLAAAQSAPPIRTISVPTDAAKQLLYAQSGGLFKKHGIEVANSAMSSGSAIIAAIVGGSADFGSGALFSVFQAFGRGIPLRVVAPISVYDTNHCDAWMIVAKDSAIHSVRDLDGKIMGGDTPNDIYVNAVRVGIDRAGGDGKSLKAIELTPAQQFPALTQGRIDVLVLRPPYLTVAMQSGNVRVIGKPLDVIAPRFLLSCWVTTQDYVDKNPDRVRRFVAALMEASRWVDAHQSETVDMVAKFSGQDPKLLAAGVRAIVADSVTLADVQKPLDFAFKYGVIDRHYDAKSVLSTFMPMTKNG